MTATERISGVGATDGLALGDLLGVAVAEVVADDVLDGEALVLAASTAEVLVAALVAWDEVGVDVGEADGDADDASGLGIGVSVNGTVLSAVTLVVALVNAAEFVCVAVDGRYAA